MLATIAREASDLASFARRADAWAASESDPPSTGDIVEAWRLTHAGAERTDVRAALDVAASRRISAAAKLWAKLHRGIDEDA